MLGWDVFRGTHPILKDLLVPFHTCAGQTSVVWNERKIFKQKSSKKPGDYSGMG